MGSSRLFNRAAVVEASVEKGRVVLLGFGAEHRGQPHGTFKLLFNSICLGASEKAAFAPSKLRTVVRRVAGRAEAMSRLRHTAVSSPS